MTTILKNPTERMLPPITQPAAPIGDTRPGVSGELAEELNRLEQEEQRERDRRREAELARLRELARFD